MTSDAKVVLNDLRKTTSMREFLTTHPLLTAVIMGLSFLCMGLITLNLVNLFHANFEYILMYGAMGLRDGGLLQLVELTAYGLLGLALYLVFKSCERVLVDRMLEMKIRS